MEEPFKALQAGRFISRGQSRHVTREITTWEMIFLVSGTLDMFEDEAEFHLVPGDRLLLRAGMRHGGISDYVADLSFFWLHFVPRTPEATALLLTAPRQLSVANRAAAAEYCQLYLARQADEPDNQAVRDLIFRLVWQECSCRAMPLPPGPAAPGTVSIPAQAARRIVQLRFYEPLSTAVIARELHCNPDYLGRIYRRNFGITITAEIHGKRLALAAKLLVDSALSIKEIAVRSGFEEPGHFRKIFFRHYAMTPRAYRARHTRGTANTE